jgi:hypothetical protein
MAVAASIFVNAVVPYLTYRALEPLYPPGSLTPLLAATIFPFLALSFGLFRKRSVDAVAVISLVEITVTILVTVAASDVRLALIARALQGTLTGLFFLATIVIRRPLLYYVARQFVAANAPTIVSGFDASNQLDRGQTFSRLTGVWGVGTILISVLNLWIAQNAQPETYLLLAPTIGIGGNVAMIAFTIRYASTRFRTLAARRVTSHSHRDCA